MFVNEIDPLTVHPTSDLDLEDLTEVVLPQGRTQN